MVALTRIRNNQVYNSDIYADAKIVAKSISGGLLSDNFTYTGNLTIGNLTVNGNTTTLDTTNLVIADPMFSLNRNASGAPAYDLGMVMGRGSATNVAFIWEENSQQFQLQYTTQSTAATTFGVINNSGYANLQAYGISLNNATITTTNITNIVASNVAITGGTINNTTIGATTPNTGVFTSVTTSAGGQHIGYLTGALGANTPNSVVATSVTTSSGGQLIGYHTGAIGANSANTGAFTTLTTTSTITSQGTISSPTINAGVIGNAGSQIYGANIAITGNALIQDGLALNTNAAIVTNQTTASVFNATATTLNVGGAATTINLAKNDGTSAVKINGTANSYGSGTGALQISGGFYAAGDSYIAGNLVVGNITSTGYNQLIANAPLLYLTANAFSTYNYEIGFYSNKVDDAYEHTGLVRNHLDNAWYLFSNIGTEPTGTVDLANASIVYDTLKLGNVIAYSGNTSTSKTTGAIVVYGGIGAQGNIYAGAIQNTPIGNGAASTGAFTTITATSTITAQGTISAPTVNAGTIGNSGAVFTGASETLTGNINALNFNGGNTATVGNLIANSGISSTSTTTGALIVSGGAGISGTVYIGGNNNVTSTENVPTIYSSNVYPYANSGNVTFYTPTNTNLTINGNQLVANLVVHGNSAAGYQNLLATNGATGAVGIKVAPNAMVANVSFQINSTDAMIMPVGAQAARPSNAQRGMIRYNTNNDQVEFYNGSSWTGTGSTFTIISSDQFTGDGSTTNFTLSQSTTTNGVIVAINGVVQIPTTAYTVSGTTLSFTEAPLSTDIIDARTITTTSTITSITDATGANTVIANTGGVYTTAVNSVRYLANSAGNFFGGGLSTLSANTSCSAGVPTIIDTFDTTIYRGAKYVITLSDYTNNNFTLGEVVLVCGASNASVQTYGVVSANGTSIGNFYANVSGTTARLIANTGVLSYAKVQQIYMPL